MKPSARADYGLRALLELALRYGQGVVQSAEIAARQGLPVAYLDQIMALLRRAGLIVSVRGPQGGHVLALPPAQVTMMQAMTVLEGPASPASSSEPEATGDPAAQRTVYQVWQEAQAAAEAVLSAITLADLAARYQAEMQEGAYQI